MDLRSTARRADKHVIFGVSYLCEFLELDIFRNRNFDCIGAVVILSFMNFVGFLDFKKLNLNI